MKILYSRWLESSKTAQDQLEQLISLFMHLLVQTNGDVDEVLEWMNILDSKYQIFSKGLTMEDFIEELKRRGYIHDEGEKFEVTPKAAQRMH